MIRRTGQLTESEIREYARNHDISKIIDKFHDDLNDALSKSAADYISWAPACTLKEFHDPNRECKKCTMWVEGLIKLSFMLGAVEECIQYNSLNNIKEIKEYLEQKMKLLGISHSIKNG